jgi:hypothetical protein
VVRPGSSTRWCRPVRASSTPAAGRAASAPCSTSAATRSSASTSIPSWLAADLADLDLAALGEPEPFAGAVLAGNVMVFLAPGTETDVLVRVGAHVEPTGFVVTGFHIDRELSLERFDESVDEAGLRVEHRFATWDLRAWHAGADFAVTVLRHR